MREKHQVHAAHLLDALHERRVKARGIDQHVPAALRRPHNQVSPRAKAGFRIEPAIIGVVHHMHGKRIDSGASAAMRNRADRRRRTCDQRHERAMLLARIPRLPVNDGLAAVIPKGCRSDLPAGVAVDARGVDIKIALDVFGEPLVDLRHTYLDSSLPRQVATPDHFIRLFWSAMKIPYNPCRSKGMRYMFPIYIEVKNWRQKRNL